MPLWIALSELFLDTELDDGDHRRIAAVVARAGIDAATGEAILRDEVLPAFAFNLLQVAGEWAGWSDADVRAIMLASLPGMGHHRSADGSSAGCCGATCGANGRRSPR